MRRRSMTNGNGGLQSQASDLPLNGSGAPPQSGPLAVGPGQAGPGAGASGDPAQGGLPVPLSQARRNGALAAGNAAAGARKGSPFSISNWRVRWRLVAIIAVPTITALILGVIQIVGSVNNYESFKRVQTLANLNALVVTATGQIADERDATVGYVASGRTNAALKQTAINDQNATTATTAQIQTDAAAVVNGSGYRAQTAIDLNGVLADISDLPNIRKAAMSTLTPALSVIQNYDLRLLQPFMAFSDDVAAGTGNATLQSDVTVLNAVLHMEDDASLQRAYLYQALESSPPALTPTGLSDLNQAIAQQSADNAQFDAVAQVGEQQILNNIVSGQAVDEAESAQSLAIATAGTTLQIGAQQSCGGMTAAQCWWTTKTTQIDDMRQVSNGSNGLVEQIQAQANSLAQSALRSAEIVSIATLLLLLLVLLITTFVARSMIRPLRKLRADALEVAGSKLPDMVRRLSQSEGGDASAEIEPIGVNSTDEIGEVARAFDQVHREAVRLAADEAMLRGNLNAMFVNLSRRSQSLIERQLSLIDNLEQTEQDADRLSSLFRLDHLATRMRRNSENLLVLAGHEAASRRWSQPVPLVDVLRAAISEIEQYERVVLNVQPGIQVIGQAVNDVVHLVAEIVENATTFSPEDTQVYVTGQPLTSGGVLLDITDNGVGISEQEMAHANWRLDNPPVVDVAVSRRMGLFVVGRLAARHGVRVRLRHAQSGGLTALIWLPESVAMPESAQPLGRLRKFEADDFGPAPSLSAPTALASPSAFAPGPGAPAGPVGAAPGAPSAPGAPGSPGAPSAPGGLGSAAATAARIPRLSGGGNGAGGIGDSAAGANGGNGGFSAFGVGGAKAAGGNARGGLGNGGNAGNGVGAGANGGNGNGSVIEVPGGSLPVRTPGTNPLGPTGNGSGGGSMFGGDGFGADEIGASDFGTTRLPALGGDGGSAASGPKAIVVPPVGNAVVGSDGSQVTIPPAGGAAPDHRLPIFDSLESDWFRRSGNVSLSSNSAAAPAAPAAAGQTWSSPADEGYRAARVAAEPASDETTTAGLPKRTPRANLVPGSVGGGSGGDDTDSAPPARSAETIRSRMASFQRGVRDARATASQNEEP